MNQDMNWVRRGGDNVAGDSQQTDGHIGLAEARAQPMSLRPPSPIRSLIGSSSASPQFLAVILGERL
jgi:hypothetical protein